MRKDTIKLLKVVRQKEIDRFSNAVRNCIQIEASTSSLTTQAIMRHQMEALKQKLENIPKASFIFLIPASKYYLENDNHDLVGLLQTMLARLDETFQDSYQLEELWFKVCSNRELLFSLLSYKNLNDI